MLHYIPKREVIASTANVYKCGIYRLKERESITATNVQFGWGSHSPTKSSAQLPLGFKHTRKAVQHDEQREVVRVRYNNTIIR